MGREQANMDICVVTDRSESLKEVETVINEALKDLVPALKEFKDRYGCNVCFTLVSFANGMTRNVDFVPLEQVDPASLELHFAGQTNPGPALKYVVEKAMDRYDRWRSYGEERFRPIIFFFTDGMPYPDAKYMPEYEEVAKTIRALDADKKLLVVCGGYGDVNVENLKLLTAFPEDRVVIMSKGREDQLSQFFTQKLEKTASDVVTDPEGQVKVAFE